MNTGLVYIKAAMDIIQCESCFAASIHLFDLADHSVPLCESQAGALLREMFGATLSEHHAQPGQGGDDAQHDQHDNDKGKDGGQQMGHGTSSIDHSSCRACAFFGTSKGCRREECSYCHAEVHVLARQAYHIHRSRSYKMQAEKK